jgi:hypothetical protein
MDERRHMGDDFARKLASMQPGTSCEHDYKFGAGFPKEHLVDTVIGVFTLKDRISDDRAIIVPAEAN